ncbi:hypothetical protein ACWGLG_45190 [Streptomyces antimycoticus]
MGGAPATAIATRRPGSQTRLVYKFHSATWNLLANKAGAELLNDNVRQIGAPKFTDADHALAKAVQKSLGKPEVGMPTDLTPLAPPAAAYTGGLATDTADISRQAPTAVLLSAAYPPGVPNHNWGATATAATNIGHQAPLSAAQLPGGGRDRPDRAAGPAGRDEAGVQKPYRGHRVGLDDPRRHPASAVRATRRVPEGDRTDLAAEGCDLAGAAGGVHRAAGHDGPGPRARDLTHVHGSGHEASADN